MGAIVEFREVGGRTPCAAVYPGQANIASSRISMLTPIGTPLLGLAEGQSMAWDTRDGRTCRLVVTSVRTESGTEPTSE